MPRSEDKQRSQETHRLKALYRKVAIIRKQLQDLERELEEVSAGSRTKAVRPRRPNARRLNDITLADAMAKVMSRRKRPIHYQELTELLQKRKLYKTKGKSLTSIVMVTLKRDPRFEKVEPGLYALKRRR